MKRKLILLTLLILLLSSSWTSKKKNIYFTKERSSSCSMVDGKSLDGFKISMLAPGQKKFGHVNCGYELDKVFSGYSNNEKIELLEALLAFEGDTSLCAKAVCNYGATSFHRPKTKIYTTQIDALYLFTILTVSSYSPNYCPFPVLFDNKTGEEINYDQKKISKIFKIYRKWLQINKKQGFVNYNVPLRDDRFEWFSTQKGYNYTDDNFKIAKLGRAAIVVGVCRN